MLVRIVIHIPGGKVELLYNSLTMSLRTDFSFTYRYKLHENLSYIKLDFLRIFITGHLVFRVDDCKRN